MTTDPQVISKMAAHFSPPNMRELVAETLRESGVEMGSASIEEVAMFDQLHVGGLDANRRLAALAQIGADDLVLDAGCGAGGAARFLATTFGCEVRGIDMTPALLETGELLNEATGLGDKVSLQLGDVTAVPFEDETFDVAWLQHVTQSVPDTADMYAEMRRVLKPGGRLVVHDFFRGPGDPIHFPSLMGPEASDVFLVPESELREIFDAAGLELVHWDDRTAEARAHNDVPYDDAESDPAMQAMKVMAENSVKDFDAGSVKMFDALLRRR